MPLPLFLRRKHDFRVHGHIPDVPVGTKWKTRQEASDAAVHSGIIGGISGNKADGAFSIVMSRHFEDEDHGETFMYTGAGGHDPKQRTGPQLFDQTLEHGGNAALKLSSITKKPVRVVRGANPMSDFAPAEGYRYDGLYIVQRAWREPSRKKPELLVCKFEFRRVEGQPPIPRKEGNYKFKGRKKSRSPSTAGTSSSARSYGTFRSDTSSIKPEPVEDHSFADAPPVKRSKVVNAERPLSPSVGRRSHIPSGQSSGPRKSVDALFLKRSTTKERQPVLSAPPPGWDSSGGQTMKRPTLSSASPVVGSTSVASALPSAARRRPSAPTDTQRPRGSYPPLPRTGSAAAPPFSISAAELPGQNAVSVPGPAPTPRLPVIAILGTQQSVARLYPGTTVDSLPRASVAAKEMPQPGAGAGLRADADFLRGAPAESREPDADAVVSGSGVDTRLDEPAMGKQQSAAELMARFSVLDNLYI